VSERKVSNIRREKNDRNGGKPLSVLGKKRTRKPERNVITDNFDLCAVKRIVDKKTVPTCAKVLQLIRQKTSFC
jgi:hypothetical protein